MLFRNDETKEEREAREDIFGSKLSAPANEAPTMEVDRPPTPTQNVPLRPPNQGLPVQKITQPSASAQQTPAPAAPVKMFGMGSSFGTSFLNPENPPVVPSTSTAPPLEVHRALPSTPFIRTAPVPAASASGGSTSASAVPSVWREAVADEDEDEEMPEINIESDSE